MRFHKKQLRSLDELLSEASGVLKRHQNEPCTWDDGEPCVGCMRQTATAHGLLHTARTVRKTQEMSDNQLAQWARKKLSEALVETAQLFDGMSRDLEAQNLPGLRSGTTEIVSQRLHCEVAGIGWPPPHDYEPLTDKALRALYPGIAPEEEAARAIESLEHVDGELVAAEAAVAASVSASEQASRHDALRSAAQTRRQAFDMGDLRTAAEAQDEMAHILQTLQEPYESDGMAALRRRANFLQAACLRAAGYDAWVEWRQS